MKNSLLNVKNKNYILSRKLISIFIVLFYMIVSNTHIIFAEDIDISTRILQAINGQKSSCHFSCGSYFFGEIIANWDNLTPEDRNALRHIKIYKDSTGNLTIDASEPTLESSYSYGHFVVEYTTIGVHAVLLIDNNVNNVPDYVETLAKRFEDNTWKYEIEILGYPAPPTPYKIRIMDIPTAYPEMKDYLGIFIPEVITGIKVTKSHIVVDNNVDLEIKSWKLNGIDIDAHEFFHAITAHNYIYYRAPAVGDTDGTKGGWWEEASAIWMGDQVPAYDITINYYVSLFFSLQKNILNSPEIPLNSWIGVYPESVSIFCKYLTERKAGSWTPDIIKQIWEKCATTKTALDAIDSVLSAKLGIRTGGLAKEFEKFTVCNFIEQSTTFIDNSYNYADDAVGDYPNMKMTKEYNATGENQHYILVAPDRPGGALPLVTLSLSHLAANYIKFLPPAKLNKPTKITIEFKAGRPEMWGKNVVLVHQDNTKEVRTLTQRSGGRFVGTFDFGITKSAPKLTEVKEAILIVSNLLERGGPDRNYSYGAVITPQFREAYTPNPTNGTTKTVKNLDPKNIYWNNETIRLETEVSDPGVELDADFSGIDTQFDEKKSIEN
jgi:hypothetical protein